MNFIPLSPAYFSQLARVFRGEGIGKVRRLTIEFSCSNRVRWAQQVASAVLKFIMTMLWNSNTGLIAASVAETMTSIL